MMNPFEEEQYPQSTLLTGPQTHLQPTNSMLTAPPAYTPQYSEEDRINPRRQFWAGMLMDLGNMFGSWNGNQFTRPLTGMGFKQSNLAHTQNQRMNAANQRGAQQHYQNQFNYDKANLGQQNYQNQQQALADYREQQQENWDKAFNLQQAEFALKTRKMTEEMQNAGYTPDEIKLVRDQRNDFQKATKKYTDVHSSARTVITALNQGSGAGDIAGMIGFYKNLDPGSVVSSGEQASLEAASGLISKINGYRSKLEGSGVLSNEARQDLAATVTALAQLSEQDYAKFRAEEQARVSHFPDIDSTRILGGEYDFTLPEYVGASAPTSADDELTKKNYRLKSRWGLTATGS